MVNLRLLIQILSMDDWYINDEDIQIAKGKYKSPMTLKEVFDRVKRNK